ncbi:MAG: helix-hairpin-helix domain-containing protein [Clostridium sp.]|nr:helix-hairpin-helix domain-containing protein [Clostridium sp.]MCI7442614.1 helix-hairpin-helix domain-containing protein [Clostridium sp.]
MKKYYKTIGTIIIGVIIFLFFIISYFSGGSSELNKNNNENIFVEENESMEVITKKEEKEIVKIVVDIKGEIKNPNIYWLEEGCIIEDLINIAGGITEEGDLSKINRAQKLNDHEVVIIPNINDKESEIENIIPSSNDKNKVNINTASINELDTLSGIGPSKAEAIIKYREENGTFKSIEEIKNVTGIGEALFEKFKENITI